MPCNTRRESREGYTEFPRLPQSSLYDSALSGINSTKPTTIKAAWYANTLDAP